MRKYGVFAGMVASLMFAAMAFASDTAVVDYSSDVSTGLVGLVAGVAATIAAVLVFALAIRATKIGARQAMKALGLIK